jgi:alpha-1,6-mannosyltransferase
LPLAGPARGGAARLVDTTMLFTPASGGVKRYLLAKQAWLARNRPQVIHRFVLPALGRQEGDAAISWVRSPALPLGGGYQWPLSSREWAAKIEQSQPTLIEAGDPYAPGLGALRAGRELGVPVIGFCHTDISALAATYFGDWTVRLAQRLWVDRCKRFDAILAPSHYTANRLREAGVEHVEAVPLGVDVETFTADRSCRDAVRRALGVGHGERLLVFAGRNSPEKRVEVLVEAAARLGAPYRLLLIGAGDASLASPQVINLPFQPVTSRLARLLASCDAFVHANPHETLGLIALEAMACGLPVVGPDAGGLGEIVDDTIGARAHGANADALAQAIASVFARDPVKIGEAARARAVERHSWGRTFEHLTAIYQGLTGDTCFTATRSAKRGIAH